MSSHGRLQWPRSQHGRDPRLTPPPLLTPPICLHQTLTRPDESRDKTGVLWLCRASCSCGPIIFEVPLSNVGHYEQISFCVNMQRLSRAVCVCVRVKPWRATTDVWRLLAGWVLMYRILMIVYLGSVLDRRAIYLSDARVAAAPLCLLLFQLKNPDFFFLFLSRKHWNKSIWCEVGDFQNKSRQDSRV